MLLLSEHTQLQDARRIAQALQQQQLAQPVLSEAEQQPADAQAAHDAETDALRLRVMNCLQDANVHIAEAEARHTDVDVYQALTAAAPDPPAEIPSRSWPKRSFVRRPSPPLLKAHWANPGRKMRRW